MTFRLNSGEAGFQRVSQMLQDPGFIKQFLERENAEDAVKQTKQETNTATGKPVEETKDEEVKTGNAAAVNMD